MEVQKRPELRLIISSATLDAEELRDYFDLKKRKRKATTDESNLEHKDYDPGSATIMSVSGRHYSVEVFYVQGKNFTKQFRPSRLLKRLYFLLRTRSGLC